MLTSTLARLRCPARSSEGTVCGSILELRTEEALPKDGVAEVRTGTLKCCGCAAEYPILAGVPLLVEDVYSYLLAHVKGISRLVPDEEIPADFLPDYLEAKAEIEIEHIEEDLEAERVVALYLATHYLRADSATPWWNAGGSPLIDSLIRQYWDQGPFARIQCWVAELADERPGLELLELGCGVGGLYPVLKKHLGAYLGVDSSFASVALARHLALGVPYPLPLAIPGDLLEGPLAREVRIGVPGSFDGTADFVVGSLYEAPIEEGRWDLTVALNTIDMLDEPESLPALQCRVLKPGGIAIQSCPYIWHASVAAHLRAMLPKGETDSARAVELLYRNAGFEIGKRADHVPWLFYKHARQLEIYSVHLFTAEKT